MTISIYQFYKHFFITFFSLNQVLVTWFISEDFANFCSKFFIITVNYHFFYSIDRCVQTWSFWKYCHHFSFKNFAFSSYWINVSSFKVRWGTRRIFQLILINCTFFYKYKDKRNQSFSRQEKNSDLHKIIYKRAVSSSHFQLLLFPS